MAEPLIGSVVNGAYKKTAASQDATKANTNISTSKTAETKDGGYTEEMFMKLLVAEMQYQDPLEPTDNSQYVAQLASFTQIEAIQAVQADMKNIQGNSMVGKMVALIDDDNVEIHGRVDYVRTDDDGQLLASVNNKEYPVEKIKSIMDETYYNAVLVADTILADISKLPTKDLLTLGNEEDVVKVATMINSLDAYTKGFLGKDVTEYVQSLVDKIAELKKTKQEAEEEVNKRTTPKTEEVNTSTETAENSGAAATSQTTVNSETTEEPESTETSPVVGVDEG
ncbi:flagellar basal-body rod modification protein FlgD [Pseudobutyrivibrio sp. AR14]|uniref:flagellar hook assembly protein FlgD n=1 Tax=Pseudobutyrivibrio sp. AR14 TaxID=1520804 RepID=UPI000886E764|nr:flagellar hook capping FlgD N-terminal domain-containing protein [Pseudobutyrivibrio sp. AR14]SCX85711.1 flagellar basal-body rod modification protein FlgD [Pseudobutyrivibrio sp. AR14]